MYTYIQDENGNLISLNKNWRDIRIFLLETEYYAVSYLLDTGEAGQPFLCSGNHSKCIAFLNRLTELIAHNVILNPEYKQQQEKARGGFRGGEDRDRNRRSW